MTHEGKISLNITYEPMELPLSFADIDSRNLYLALVMERKVETMMPITPLTPIAQPIIFKTATVRVQKAAKKTRLQNNTKRSSGK
jgi:hypothetical protein